MYSLQAKIDEIRFLEDNKKIFRFFKCFGMYLVKHDGRQFRVSFGLLLISKVLWMLWHLVGTALACYVWTNSREPFSDDDYTSLSGITSLFLDVCAVLVCYLFVGPIQSSILRYTMEAFPTILKLVKKIEDLDFESKVESRFKKIRPTKIILRRRDEFEARQQKAQLDEITTISTVTDVYHDKVVHEKSGLERTFSANPVVNRVAKKTYDLIQKFWIGIMILIGLIAFAIVCLNGIFTEDFLKYEWKLVLMSFFLVFPVITTWFCIVLIEHHRNMYKVLSRLKDESFNSKENNMLKDIAIYINTLQKLFRNLSENIFEFTLGINFAIFTIISTASTYEILQNLHIFQGEVKGNRHYADIVYVFPLAVCIGHIYVVCKRNHDLKNRAHDHLAIRLKEMLPDLLMEEDKDKEKIFKKVETLYKNLKDWPPQVCIYGGFRVNYRILAAILFFSFAYARTFNRLNRTNPLPETECDLLFDQVRNAGCKLNWSTGSED